MSTDDNALTFHVDLYWKWKVFDDWRRGGTGAKLGDAVDVEGVYVLADRVCEAHNRKHRGGMDVAHGEGLKIVR